MNKLLILVAFVTLGIATAFAQSMDWLCQPGIYSRIEYLGGDLFKVRTPQGKFGLMHADGELRVPAMYDSITPFVENRAVLLDRTGKRLLGLVDESGRIIQHFSSKEYYVQRYPNFKEGRLAYSLANGLCGYMNDKGATVIEPQFYFASPFQDGIAAVQYTNGDYGLINKAGRSAIVSDSHYSFVSAPVDGQVLVVKGSRKGADQLVLMRIDGTDLKKVKVLEDGMNIWLSDDFSSVECQLGHSYDIDNQWRVASSSHNARLPQPAAEPVRVVTENNTVLGKVATEAGIKITYLGKPITALPYPNVTTYDKSYAVVRSADGKVGVLKLNPGAAITIKAPDGCVELTHNQNRDVLLDVDLQDVDPAKIKWYRNVQGELGRSMLEQVNGQWKLRMPYFHAANMFDKETPENVDIAITYDGLDWIHQYVRIKSLHRQGFRADLTGESTADSKGRANLSLNVYTLYGNADTRARVIVDGIGQYDLTGHKAKIEIPVTVPAGSQRTFNYNVTVKEEGCPDYRTTVSFTVKGPKKESETKEQQPANNGIIIQ